jgi:molybdenum cofactor biosynthesis protein MoaC
MIDITHKRLSLRVATAEAIVKLSDIATADAVREGRVPKGDVFTFAKAAALFAVKRTSDMIPDCHPMPVESATVTSLLEDLCIRITVEVKTVYKTGVEVEAMHAASVAALTMYDMLKPLDKGIEISRIWLVQKTGGKSDTKVPVSNLLAAVIVCSDSRNKNTDSAGTAIEQRLMSEGLTVRDRVIIPDQPDSIRQKFDQYTQSGVHLLVFCGGTGISPTDHTPDIIRPLLDTEVPGIMEAARAYGMDRTPMAMLSRSIAGVSGNSLILCLPGSERAATEYLDALFPQVLHAFSVMKGHGH